MAADAPCPDTENPTDEEYRLPCTEALLASTMALMTGHAHTAEAPYRDAMARKIIVNLQALSQMPGLTSHFRTMLRSLQTHWTPGPERQAAAQENRDPEPRPQALWHAAPEAVQ
ncbi:hypothetical protein AVME950_13280 [Acidovorax sp. SUPP950]|uniref:hypothetical protein n=1 Tax=unclassified Acidovorax TaxID=2684926 RepID=UPI0023C42FF2|nr:MULTISPECIES: hypothetical protein [Comamonadaceae]WOI47752.1 hypothetical protein R1Z03_11270 [Paracidovorax avenae]GKS75874.1 hypothetical protein AVME950_13280 [Acidovorax sp. SUPP950]